VDGQLTEAGVEQARLLGRRLAGLRNRGIRFSAVYHSPLARAAATASIVANDLPGVSVNPAVELTDHLPPVPADVPARWREIVGAYDADERATGTRLAAELLRRFAGAPTTETHEVLITHAFQVAWLVRHALDAPSGRWMGLNHANAALTVIELRKSRPPALVVFNEMTHLPPHLRWTGFPETPRP
jgi:serine/threonine-protein phosphatase PGAM5